MDLPLPEAPTIARVSPGSTVSENPSRTGRSEAPLPRSVSVAEAERSEAYANRTSSNSIPAGASAGSSLVPSFMEGSVSMVLQDALHTGAGLLADGEDHGEHPDRADELGEVGGEGDERAEGDLAPGGQPAAEGEHGDLAEGGHGLEGGGVAGVQPDRAQPPCEEPPADLTELAGLLVLLAEPLDDPDAGDSPVDDSGDGGGLALGVPGGGEEAGLGAAGDEPEGGGDGEGDEGERQGQPRHDHQGDDEEQDVPDGHREHEQQPLDELEVAGGPPDDLPGGQLVLTLPVEPGDRRVHVRTQIVLDVQGEPAAVVAADVGGDVDEDGGPDEESGPERERARVVGDDVVDDHLGDQRHEGHDGHPGERGTEREQDVPPVPPRVPGQPSAPPLSLCARHALPPGLSADPSVLA